MDYDKFAEKFMRLAAKLHQQYLYGEQAYLQRIWNEIGQKEPPQMSELVEQVIRRDFVSDGDPPRWIYEPAWPVVHDQPMQFVCQVAEPDGDEVYFFRYKRPCDDGDGWEAGYCAVTQSKMSTGFPIGFVRPGGKIRLGFDLGDHELISPGS